MKPRHPDDGFDERAPRKKHYIQCSDGMCGSDDCKTCKPGNFRGGVYVGDIEENEKQKD